ncbi:MAG: hypothetical protein ACHQF3_10515 [Alphaproteobacteria bacterium]
MRVPGCIVALVIMAATMASAPALAQAPGDPFPTNIVRIYKPLDVKSKILYGDFWLSNTIAYFDQLRGRMAIRFDGALPASANADISEARVYRILNWAQYSRLNRRKNGFCAFPIKWLGLRDLGNMQLRVTLFLTEDYHAATPDDPGICSADSYRLVP